MITAPYVAIVNYGMGNLFSVAQACAYAGIPAVITDNAHVVRVSSGVILPGVGAFGDAMKSLRAQGLIAALEEIVASGRPILGVCLGMQLLMKTSVEFGQHKGLGFIDGEVVPFHGAIPSTDKVPHIGWNTIHRTMVGENSPILRDLQAKSQMYFVHSFYVQAPESVVATTTTYGGLTFCSSIFYKNIIACQFHPERSGRDGIRMYKLFAPLVLQRRL